MAPKYLIIKAKGGMGNRMLSTATGLLYAEASGRQAIVDWSDAAYGPEGVNSFPSFFRPVGCSCELPELNNLSTVPLIWSSYLEQPVSRMIQKYDPDKHSSILIHRKYSIDPGIKNYTQDIAVYWSYTERLRRLSKAFPQLVGDKKEQTIRKILLERFPLKEEILTKIQEIKSSVWQETVIGIHVRFTDRKIALERYEKHLHRLLKKHPEAHIFLATDSVLVTKHFKERYRNVISMDKWYPNAPEPLHQNNNCPDKIKNGIAALIDMYILAECDILIYPKNSTFSWISSILSNAETKIDVCKWDVKVQAKRLIREYIQ